MIVPGPFNLLIHTARERPHDPNCRYCRKDEDTKQHYKSQYKADLDQYQIMLHWPSHECYSM